MTVLRIKDGRIYHGGDEVKLLNPETGNTVPLWDYSNEVRELWYNIHGFRRTKNNRLISTRSVRVLSNPEAHALLR